jgi:hypothetical protein
VIEKNKTKASEYQKMNKTSNLLIEAFNRGYRVISGKVYLQKKEISIFPDTTGRLKFCLENNKPYFVAVHRLVAYQKFGNRIFEGNIHIRHRDGNYLNNLEDNILIGTPSDNMMDIPKELRIEHARIAAQKSRKFTNEEVEQIKSDYLQCKSYKRIMTKWKITSKGTFYYILKHKYVT